MRVRKVNRPTDWQPKSRQTDRKNITKDVFIFNQEEQHH